jgi:hypothetical protein
MSSTTEGKGGRDDEDLSSKKELQDAQGMNQIGAEQVEYTRRTPNVIYASRRVLSNVPADGRPEARPKQQF